MSGVLFCNVLGWTSLIASWGIHYIKFKDNRFKYAIGMALASFSMGMFIATMILK